jgi:hypothetical protein
MIVTVTVDNQQSGAESRSEFITVTMGNKNANVIVSQDASAQAEVIEYYKNITGNYIMSALDPFIIYGIPDSGYEGVNNWGPFSITVNEAADTTATVNVFEIFPEESQQPPFTFIWHTDSGSTTGCFYLIPDETPRANIEVQMTEGGAKIKVPYYQEAYVLAVNPISGKIMLNNQGEPLVFGYRLLPVYTLEDGTLSMNYSFKVTPPAGSGDYAGIEMLMMPALGASIDYNGQNGIWHFFAAPVFTPYTGSVTSTSIEKALANRIDIKYEGELKQVQFAPQQMQNSQLQRILKRK